MQPGFIENTQKDDSQAAPTDIHDTACEYYSFRPLFLESDKFGPGGNDKPVDEAIKFDPRPQGNDIF